MVHKHMQHMPPAPHSCIAVTGLCACGHTKPVLRSVAFRAYADDSALPSQASEQLEQTLITLKGVSQDDDVYIPTHAAARGGIGSFAVGMQRAGLPNLPGFAELTKRALEAKTLAASQLLGSRVGSATGGKPWHKVSRGAGPA